MPLAAPSTTTSKPIKLRSACNQCFAAKVRCDGNKSGSGCERCLDRKLPCKYSESRVGKVVGRRRKRPLEDAVGTVNSSEWVIANYTPPNAMPSPANTSASEDSGKFLNLKPSWLSGMESTNHSNFSTVPLREPSPAQSMDSYSFIDRKVSLPGSTGLPTPALSPPQYAYLSPMMLENRPHSTVHTTSNTTSQFLAPAMPTPAARTPEPQEAEDEEMVCIKLLGHLKKSSAKECQSLDDLVSLVRKSNAVIRRILKSKKARSDYACVMLLSNIILRVVDLCESASRKHFEEPDGSDAHFLSAFNDNFFSEPEQIYFNTDFPMDSTQADRGAMLREMITQSADLVSAVGSLLQRKPLNGFQALGRHEVLHLELAQRLQATLKLLG